MSDYIELTNTIVTKLKQDITGVNIAASPLATVIPLDDSEISLSAYTNDIVVWLDQVQFNQNKRFSDGSFNPIGTLQDLSFVISIGKQSFNVVPDIDKLIIKVLVSLSNFRPAKNMQTLMPKRITPISTDKNKVYWRQIFFESILQSKADIL